MNSRVAGLRQSGRSIAGSIHLSPTRAIFLLAAVGLTLTDHPPYIVALMTSGYYFDFHHISTDEVFGSLAGTGYFVRRQPGVYRGERLGSGS